MGRAWPFKSIPDSWGERRGAQGRAGVALGPSGRGGSSGHKNPQPRPAQATGTVLPQGVLLLDCPSAQQHPQAQRRAPQGKCHLLPTALPPGLNVPACGFIHAQGKTAQHRVPTVRTGSVSTLLGGADLLEPGAWQCGQPVAAVAFPQPP